MVRSPRGCVLRCHAPAWMFIVCVWGGITAARAEAGAGGAVDLVFDQLIAEARELDRVKQVEHRMVTGRPHYLVESLSAEDGPAVLKRMAEKLTGDPFRDAYIRWHLMPVVQDWLNHRYAAQDQPESTSDDREAFKALRSLFRSMPGEADTPYVSPYDEAGKAINRKLRSLRAQTRVTVGVPPFEKTYSGRAALPHMTPAARKRAEPIVREIERLQDQLKQTSNRNTARLNQRYTDIAKAAREYRFDLTCCMIQTGDDRLLSEVGDAIGKLVRDRQRAGLDLMQAVYKATWEGWLGRYDERSLARFRGSLERIARAAEQYETYQAGDESVAYYVKPNARSFGAYAAHLLDLLAEPGYLRTFTAAEPLPDPEPASPPAGPFDPDTLSIKDIRQAIRAATYELQTASQQRTSRAGRILPNDTIRHDSYYWSLHRYNQGKPIYQEVIHEVGNHALVCWAMLSAGEPYQSPRMSRRIHRVLASDTPYTYDRGMRLMMLSRLPESVFTKAAERDLSWLKASVTDLGNFNEQYTGGPSTGLGDHGSGLYGILGLYGADRRGMSISAKSVWKPIDQHWRRTQQRTPGDEPAGWAIGIAQGPATEPKGNMDDAKTVNRRSTVTGPMTAAGVVALSVSERALYSSRQNRSGQSVSRELSKGIHWLDEHFDPNDSPYADWYYYMWTIQRVGQITGRRTFNDIDWYRTITAEMLNRQDPDGLWRDPAGQQGTLLSTGFALLYLAEALQPVAVSKLRFDGAWNNRPNDLWNFSEYASTLYEVDTTWQVITLDQSVHELSESPILYWSTHEPFTLPTEQIQTLRSYLDAGGMLVVNPESPFNRLAGSCEALVSLLYPGRKFEPVADFHPFYDLHTKLNRTVPMRMIHNGVRPLIVVLEQDIGRGLQSRDSARFADCFALLSNLYLYAVGTESRRTRLHTNHILMPNPVSGEIVRVARVRHSGAYDPEPAALKQLRAILARDHGIDLKIQTFDADQLTDQPLAYLTTSEEGSLSDGQASALRAWVENGGTLWVDAAGGTRVAVESAQKMLRQVFPDKAITPLKAEDPIYTGQGLGTNAYDNRRVTFSRFALRQMGQSTEPRLQSIEIDGRVAVVYSPEDLTAAMAGCEHWGIFGYDPDSARRLMVNGVLAVVR